MSIDRSSISLRNNAATGFNNVTDADGISEIQYNSSIIEIVECIETALQLTGGTIGSLFDLNAEGSGDTDNVRLRITGDAPTRSVRLQAEGNNSGDLAEIAVSAGFGNTNVSQLVYRTSTQTKFLQVSSAAQGILIRDEFDSVGLVGEADFSGGSNNLAYAQRIWVQNNTDARTSSVSDATFETDRIVDTSLGRRINIALTADRQMASVVANDNPTLLVVSGDFQLTPPELVPPENIRGNTNYNNPVIMVYATDSGTFLDYINDPAGFTRESALSSLTVDMGAQSNNILTRTVTGTENVTITNPMLNGIFTIRATGGTALTVNSQTPVGDAYTPGSQNVIDVRCVRVTPSALYSVVNEAI